MNGMKWKIWFKTFSDTGAGVCVNSYTRKGNAVRAAKKQFDGLKGFGWTVSQTNPSIVKE